MSYIAVNGKQQENPLAKFKSYSYYHVLAVCNSSETADVLASQTSDIVDSWLHPAGTVGTKTSEDLGRYAPKSLGQGMQYCILINGATDSTYSITKVAIQTLVGAGAVNNDRYTSLAVEGEIEISEPKGVSFLDTIVRCCASLEKDPAHVTFVLKTFFVGYNQNDQIETIPGVTPLSFIVRDANGTFTEAGGMYHLDIVALQNGVSRLPQFDKMLRMPPIKGGSLQEVVDLMQTSIDENYERMFQCVYKQVQQSDPSIVGNLKRVKYKIELSDLYKTSAYTFNPSHQQSSDTGVCTDAAQISPGTDVSLESALHLMMQHCQRVEKDSREGITTDIKVGSRTLGAGTKCGYKIHTSLSSSASNGDNSAPYTVTYRIEPFPNPKDLTKDTSAISSFVEPNTIHFDYIYTGKNVDILNFDMKVNLGLAYLMTASIRNTFKDQGENTPVDTIVPSPSAATDASNRMRTVDNTNSKIDIPVFFGTTLDIPAKRTTSDPVATANSVYDMTKHSSVEVLEASVKVTGNLLLLHSTMVQTQQAAKQYVVLRDSIEDQNALDWGYVPCFAKINVRMPASNDDLALFAGQTNSYTKEFWYDYYYLIAGVDHVFEDGNFTQTLSLIGMPRPAVGNSDQQNAVNDAKSKFSTGVTDCYTNAIKSCGTDSSGTSRDGKERVSAARSPNMRTNQQMVPATAIDKIVSTMPASNVQGWEKMSPAVKNAVVTQTKGDRIPLSTYVAIAAIESNGHPGAVSSTGAKGIFQFTGSTWTQVMKSSPTSNGGDARNDPNLSAVAARRYLNSISNQLGGTTDPTWLYMGHNLGPAAAAAIYREAASGNSNRSIASIYAQHPSWPNWNRFSSQNGYNVNSTVGNIRDQIAAKYKRRLKDINEANFGTVSSTTAANTKTTATNTTSKTQPTTSAKPVTTTGNTAAEAVNRTAPSCSDGTVGSAGANTQTTPQTATPSPCGNKAATPAQQPTNDKPANAPEANKATTPQAPANAPTAP